MMTYKEPVHPQVCSHVRHVGHLSFIHPFRHFLTPLPARLFKNTLKGNDLFIHHLSPQKLTCLSSVF